MIRELSFGYFFLNYRKTYVAVILLGLTVSIVLSTSLVLNGYQNEINNIPDIKIGSSQFDLHVKPEDGNFTESKINEMTKLLVGHGNDLDYFWSYVKLIDTKGKEGLLEFRVTDFLKLNSSGLIHPYNYLVNTIYVSNIERINSSTLDYIFHQKVRKVEHLNDLTSYPQILVHPRANFLKFEWKVWNQIDIKINKNSIENSLRNEIKSLNGLVIEGRGGGSEFVQNSFTEILSVLQILQFVLSVLLTFSITYIMISIIDDSKEDLKLFQMMGMTNRNRISIFIFQGVIITLFGFVLALLSSYFFVNVLVSVLHSITSFPFMTIQIGFGQLLVNLASVSLIGILSGIISTFKVVYSS